MGFFEIGSYFVAQANLTLNPTCLASSVLRVTAPGFGRYIFFKLPFFSLCLSHASRSHPSPVPLYPPSAPATSPLLNKNKIKFKIKKNKKKKKGKILTWKLQHDTESCGKPSYSYAFTCRHLLQRILVLVRGPASATLLMLSPRWNSRRYVFL